MTSQELTENKRDEFARLIKEALTVKGLSQEDVAAITRISPPAIQDLVEGRLEVFATPVVARGFIRSLSRVLGLEAAKMVELYNLSTDVAAKEVLRPLKGVGGQVGPKDSLRVRMIEEVLSFKPVRRFALPRFIPKNARGLLYVALIAVALVSFYQAAGWIRNNFWTDAPMKQKIKPVATIEELPRGAVSDTANSPSTQKSLETAPNVPVSNGAKELTPPVTGQSGSVPIQEQIKYSDPTERANSAPVAPAAVEKPKAFGGMMENPESIPDLSVGVEGQ